MRHHVVLRLVSGLLIPFIALFAFYVQFHGDFGPGGGFQAGVIAGAAIILYALVFGTDAALRVVPQPALRILVPAGVLIYGGVGIADLFLGGRYLEYSVMLTDSVRGQHLGIFLIELGVGTTVAAVMVTVFLAFAGRGR